MKFLVLSVILIFGSLQDETVKDIEMAMKAGSSKELIKFCHETVEIKIDGAISSYNRNQAEVILKKFFSKNPPNEFSYIHQGSSPEGLKYTIGKYSHEKGVFRVVMVIKKIGDNYLIDTLNFSKE